MKRIGVVLGLVGCGFSPSHLTGDDTDARVPDSSIDAAPAGWLTGYGYRKAITLTTAVTTALADFPLGLVRSKDTQIAMHATGNDLAVTAADGVTSLDREVVTSAPDGTIELWVHVPSLVRGAQTLFLYYGGPNIASSTSMWADTAGVWHLSEPGPMAIDSSGGHTLAGPGPMQTPMPMPGIAGNARQYDGNDDTFTIDDPSDGSLDMGLTSFSYSMWLKVATPQAQFDTPFWKGGTSTGEIGFCILTGSGSWNAKIHDGTNYADPKLGDQTTFANQWVHVAAVLDRSAQTFTAYANGAMTESQSSVPIGTLDNSLAFDLGRPHNFFPFKGLLDEVRIYRHVLTGEWIAAEHSNLADPNFVVFGPEEMH